MKALTAIPEGLSRISNGRDQVTTQELAKVISKSSQTLRKNYCLSGEVYGLKPIKIGGRLLWNVKDIAILLTRGEI